MSNRGVNRVILLGFLGADPETRYTGSGAAITTIRLATSESWTDKSGQKQERTEWHRVKFFGKLGEIAGEYLKKGRQVYIEGSIRSDKFTGQDGQEKFMFEIHANELQMLGGGTDREQGAGPARESGARSQGGRDSGRNDTRRSNASARSEEPVAAGDFTDSVPF